VEVPEPVRLLALYPFRELPHTPSVTSLVGPGVELAISKHPGAQVVQPHGLAADDVAAAVSWARAAAREHGKKTLAWWLGPGDQQLAPALEAHGIVNADTPGFEATENGLALVEPPSGDDVDEVDVRVVETWEDWRAGWEVPVTAFGLPRQSENELRVQYDDYVTDDAGRAFVALLDGEAVGAAYAAFADAGLNLFGGSVLPEARGRGVYRALLHARWRFAVERGTPALTVQAGRMSKPICERMGFRFLGASLVHVDELG
jgi:GNAT superfamily N-acetyltransferase